MKRFGAFAVSVSCVAGLLMLAGCTYPISAHYRQLAVPDLKVAEVSRDPQAHKGKVVIWGGVILDANTRVKTSELTLLETPLDFSGFPGNPEYSRGRFIVRSSQFLDPALYRRGRKVTLAGEIQEVETRSLGEGTYPYPILNAGEIHLWRRPLLGPPNRAYDWGWHAQMNPIYTSRYRPYYNYWHYGPFYEYQYHGDNEDDFYYGIYDQNDTIPLESNLR